MSSFAFLHLFLADNRLKLTDIVIDIVIVIKFIGSKISIFSSLKSNAFEYLEKIENKHEATFASLQSYTKCDENLFG